MTPRVATAEPKGAFVDTSAYPFVDVVVGPHPGHGVEAYFDEMTQLLVRPGPHVILLDCTAAHLPSTSTRRRHLEWQAAHRDLIRAGVGGVAFVIPSAVIRGALTAALWMQPLEAPHVVVRTRREALSACHHWLSSVEPRKSDRPPPCP